MQDKYVWEAQYDDGTIVKQIEDDGSKADFNQFKREGLTTFSLIDVETKERKLVVIFDGDGEKLVWTRRRYFVNTDEQPPVHIVGKKGEFVLALNYDGVVAARRNFQQDGLFDEVIQ